MSNIPIGRFGYVILNDDPIFSNLLAGFFLFNFIQDHRYSHLLKAISYPTVPDFATK